MDLFDLLVRLDLEGWKSHPPRDGVPDEGSEELQRLLRKASAVERGHERFDFTGVSDAAPPFPVSVPVRCLAAGPRSTWLLFGEEDVVLRFEDGVFTVLATSIPDFLDLLLEPRADTETAAQPLGDLGFDGDGWGWSLLEASPPARLVELPPEFAEEPVRVSSDCVWAGHRIIERIEEAEAGEPVDDGPELDELFGAGSGRPRPRTALVALLLFFGVLITIVGMACIAAPGGLLVLMAWMVVEKDHDRVESGYLPDVDRAAVERSRNLTHAGLLLVVSLFFLQALLLCFGAYDPLLDEVYIPLWRSLITGSLGPAETDIPL